MLETFPFSRGSPRAGRPSPEEARAIRRFGRPGAMWRRLRGWFARGEAVTAAAVRLVFPGVSRGRAMTRVPHPLRSRSDGRTLARPCDRARDRCDPAACVAGADCRSRGIPNPRICGG
ncbi:hypothetical protein AQ477_04520 [Burkholderia thailandensis]|nr:hypothetical protein AQ477_04520 [Burkholderia thailandensis]KXF60143.1 hypothetical protein AQ476_01810 [Burkholderia thailandensis]